MAKIEIKNITGKRMGFGQISHEPHDYFAGFGADVALSIISANDPDVVIETNKFDVYVYLVLGKYALQAVFGKKGVYPITTSSLPKFYRNTASAECLVKACERHLNLIGYETTRQYKTQLEDRRRAEEYTQRELSAISGVHVNIIGRIERGECAIGKCDFDTVRKLATALECRVEDII